jgi:transposase
MPNDLPPWHTVCQQTQRWLKAGVFEAMVHDLREVLRIAANVQDRVGELAEAVQAAADHDIRLEVVKLLAAKKGFVLLPVAESLNAVWAGWLTFVASPATRAIVRHPQRTAFSCLC